MYEHLHTPRCVVERTNLFNFHNNRGQLEFKYINFAVGILATCKLMRDEVQPFFVKAFKTSDLEMTPTFRNVYDNMRYARKCLQVVEFIMSLVEEFADKKFGYHVSL